MDILISPNEAIVKLIALSPEELSQIPKEAMEQIAQFLSEEDGSTNEI